MPAQRGVARTGLILAAVLALCRIASLGKEMLVAGRFGAGNAIDAYALSMLVPALAMACYLSAIRRGFMVQAAQHREPHQLAVFTNRYLVQVILFSAVVAGIAAWWLPDAWPLLLSPHRYQMLAGELSRLTTPVSLLIVPTAAVSALTGVLNAQHSFSKPQWTHVIPTAAIVLAVLTHGTTDGAAPLAWALLQGTAIQAVVLSGFVHRSGHRYLTAGGSPLEGSLGFVAVVLPFLWLDAAGQINVLVDRAMAGGLPPGRLSILYWGSLGKDFLSGTLVASMLWVLLPRFSEQIANGDQAGVRHACNRVIRFSAILLLPISSLVLLAGHTVLPELSLHQLDSSACRRLGWTLAGYAWGLFPEMAGLALVQAVLILGRWKHLAAIGLIGLLLPNLTLNLLLVGPLQEVGLAISTSLTSWMMLAVASWAIRNTIGLDNPRELVYGVLLAAGYSLLAGLLGWGVALCLGTGWTSGIASIITSAGLYLGLSLGWPGHPDARLAVTSWRERSAERHHGN
ncbi:MAG TPA: hypothetical protein DIC23_15450 [Planctomycetaceae bacterium]|nr:hypothetical protein [Planctomycetaceae bacterium]